MKRHVQTVLEEDLFKAVKLVAIDERISLSTLIRKAIVAYLTNHTKEEGEQNGKETGKTN